ncbi:unnamed protein product [Protopolystoma xenopodis]|uniref:RPN1 N-terminal domain-containing protein n=1 Tax=Protopolystoma xenopodis TaxID=117903 RepID=A0A3S5B0S2_9PLAT|nr:unnamed protein product [Protopolystoma xenopodis]
MVPNHPSHPRLAMGSQGAATTRETTTVPKKEEQKPDDDLSEEDKQLQDELSLCVQRLEESNKDLYMPALEAMRSLIRSSTTSMTSVPKPLKFMRPHYSRMKDIYSKLTDQSTKKMCADLISVLGMTMTDKAEYKYDTLNYRLLGLHEEIGAWGHEYVRHLTGQIVSLWNEKDFSGTADKSEVVSEDSKDQKNQCIAMVQQTIPYLMEHNAEAEAIDLCIEIEQLDLLLIHTTKLNYQRVCLYMTSCVAYLSDPDNYKVL